MATRTSQEQTDGPTRGRQRATTGHPRVPKLPPSPFCRRPLLAGESPAVGSLPRLDWLLLRQTVEHTQTGEVTLLKLPRFLGAVLRQGTLPTRGDGCTVHDLYSSTHLGATALDPHFLPSPLWVSYLSLSTASVTSLKHPGESESLRSCPRTGKVYPLAQHPSSQGPPCYSFM